MNFNHTIFILIFLSFFSVTFSMNRAGSRKRKSRVPIRPLERQDQSINCESMQASSLTKSDLYYQKLWKIWQQSAPSCTMVHIYGYLIFCNNALMKGEYSPYTMNSLQNLRIQLANTLHPNMSHAQKEVVLKVFHEEECSIMKILARRYKIHLMPYEEDIAWMIETIHHRLQTDKKFSKNLGSLKISSRPDKIKMADGRYFPIMVLYPDSNKQAAQYVLDTVYELFKNKEGIGKPARYNRMITSLIGWAQGDGDCKDDRYAQYYDDERVCYKPTFANPRIMENYYLKDPSKREKPF